MLEKLRQNIRINKRKLALLVAFSAAVLAMSLNSIDTHLLVIGVPAFFLFLVIGGIFLGEAFFQEETRYFRFAFGVLSLVGLLILIGTVLLLVFRIDMVIASISTVLVTAGVAFLTSQMSLGALKGRDDHDYEEASTGSSFPFACIPYIALASYLLFILFNARSAWIRGSIWDVLPANFLLLYLVTNVALVGVIFSRVKAMIKLSMIMVHSVVSLMVFAVVVEPGFSLYDSWVGLGYSVTLNTYGSTIWSPIRSLGDLYTIGSHKGLPVLVSVFSRMLEVDVYWTHLLLTPILWGIFVPLTAYKTTKILGGDNSSSLLSAFLASFLFTLIEKASLPQTSTLGYVLFFFSMFLFLRYLSSKSIKTFVPMFVMASASLIAHPLPGTLSFSFLALAIVLTEYESIKKNHLWMAYTLLSMAFTVCALVLPVSQVLRGRLSPGYTALYGVASFSLTKLLSTNAWDLIFVDLIGYSFQLAALLALPLIFGVAGLGYALKNKHKYNHLLTTFLLLAFLITLIDYRFLSYAMENAPLTPSRVTSFRDFTILPFIGIAISSIIKQFPETIPKISAKSIVKRKFNVNLKVGKRSFAIALCCLLLSAFVVAVVYDTYAVRGGLQVTPLEIYALKYIDDHTREKYVVITEPRLWVLGVAYVGVSNPEKLYFYFRGSKYNIIGRDPSVDNMLWAMGQIQANVGYFVAVSFRTANYESVLEKASSMFRLYAVLRDKEYEISIFRYELYLPTSSDVTVFYEDLPPSYVVQNDLVRVSLDLEKEKLEVRDYWGKVYEGVSLSETLTDGERLGNLASVEYYADDTWVRWDPQQVVPSSFALTQQFRFRLRFEKGSLIGIVERGKPFLQLQGEGTNNYTLKLDVGRFEHLYIPGLVGAESSYGLRSREYGLLYTLSLEENVTLHPILNYEVDSSSLTYDEIEKYCNLTTTQGYVTYDVYIDNTADVGQWAYVEAWLPEIVYERSYPPISYSLDDGKTWTVVPYAREPIKTLSGTEVNWVLSKIRGTEPARKEKPEPWTYSTAGAGEYPKLPEDFTDSGGGQNRYIFGIYLPAEDEALVRLGFSVYYVGPLELTYMFKDVYDASYGLRNMNDAFTAFYDMGVNEYMGGLTLTKRPLSLAVTEDEAGYITSMAIAVAPETKVSLLSAKGVDTTADVNSDFIPDSVTEVTGDTLKFRAYESLAKFSYLISMDQDRTAIQAEIVTENDWGKSPIVTICIAIELNHEGGRYAFERGLSDVLEVEVTEGKTEKILVWP